MNVEKHLTRLAIFAAFAAGSLSAQTINTVAGSGVAAFSGDGGLAISAALNHPRGMAFDAAGNMYVADMDNSRIRRIDTSGKIVTVAGVGIAGYSGDGGPAIAAMLNQPQAVAIDNSGNVVIADTQNRRIRKIDASGTITTIAGTGTEGYSGDGGLATQAMLHQAVDLAVDAAGSIYFADSTGHRIRKIDTNGIITSLAGNGAGGYSGDGGQSGLAQLNFPVGVAVDRTNNTIYIADGDNFVIRFVNTQGIISTFAGNGIEGYLGDGGPATAARLNYTYGVRLDSQSRLYLADSSNNRVRVVANGIISTLAGTGVDGFSGDGGPAASATLNFPWSLAVDAAGNLDIGDRVNSRIRKVTLVSQAPPTLFANGTVNAASYAAAGSPNGALAGGAIVAIFGTNLASGNARAVSIPLQTTLLDTTVTMAGIPAPLFYTASGQINAQVPFEVPQGAASIQVIRGGSASSVQTAQVASFSPGIFTLNAAGSGDGAFLHSNYSLVSAANPAQAGETILMFTTGLGAVNPAVASGAAAVGTSVTLTKPVVTIGGIQASVSFSGLAPSFVGLYQVNVQVPAGLPGGSQAVVMTMGAVQSNTATVSTR